MEGRHRTYVRPVDRLIPAKKAETVKVIVSNEFSRQHNKKTRTVEKKKSTHVHTQYSVERDMCYTAELCIQISQLATPFHLYAGIHMDTRTTILAAGYTEGRSEDSF